MATTTLTVNPQKITVSGTTEHQIDFNNIIEGSTGTAVIKWISGTAVQFNSKGAITADSASLQEDDDKFLLDIKIGTNIRFKGGAGSEVFSITIVK
jgi:hypothetical protein